MNYILTKLGYTGPEAVFIGDTYVLVLILGWTINPSLSIEGNVPPNHHFLTNVM
jgi:hypothetical protein